MRFYVFLPLLLTIAGNLLFQLGAKDIPAIDQLKIKCIYRLTFQPDSTNKQDIKTEEMLLLIGSKSSKFQSLNKHLTDSLIADLDAKGGISRLQSLNAAMFPKTQFKYAIYKNYPAGKITVLDKILTDTYQYTEDKNLFKWKTTPEKAVISGYNCQKATTRFAGRDYEAWFTNEVPVSEGPYKFNGLPGLIVKVNDAKGHYTFELSSLSTPMNLTAITVPDGQIISTTKSEFTKGLANANASMPSRLFQLGVTPNSPEMTRRAEARLKSRNNPIELEQ